MTWQEHLKELTRQIVNHVDKKYTHGQLKHGGELWRKNLTANRVEEAVDQLIYTLTDAAREKEIQTELVIARGRLWVALENKNWELASHAYDALDRAYNILAIGNPEGVVPEEKEPPILEV